MECARAHVRPAIIPYWEAIDYGDGKILGGMRAHNGKAADLIEEESRFMV